MLYHNVEFICFSDFLLSDTNVDNVVIVALCGILDWYRYVPLSILPIEFFGAL